MIHDELSLLNNKPNIFSFPQSTIDTLMVEDSDKELFLSSIKMFMPRMKSHFTYQFVKFHVDSNLKYIDIIKLTKYPLPSVFNTKTKKIIINIAALQKRSISNIEFRDLYAILVYSHVCLVMSLNKAVIADKYMSTICQYMGFVFLKLFAKKYGITGSYIDKIPQFRFIVFSYIYMVFFNRSQNEAIKLASHLSKYNFEKMSVNMNDYDIRDFSQFLKLLSDGDITPGLNKYKFLEQVIRSFGVMNVPFFEDFMRFASIIVASSINGNSYFSISFHMFNPSYYNKVLDIINNSVN